MNNEKLTRLSQLLDIGQKIAAIGRIPGLQDMAGASGIMLAKQFREEFPDELEEAGRMRAKAMEGQRKKGRELWGRLHKRAIFAKKPDPETEGKWLEAFRGDVAREICARCANEMSAYMAENPVDFGNYFEWTVAFHNHVNRQLKKAEMEAEKARAQWA